MQELMLPGAGHLESLSRKLELKFLICQLGAPNIYNIVARLRYQTTDPIIIGILH
jgi:hypothetical protein